MPSSGRQLRVSGHREGGHRVAAIVELAFRNRAAVGGATAFLVALSFVSANALWYQPHAHPGAFFATRGFPEEANRESQNETTIRIERPKALPGKTRPDAKVSHVQAVLRDLDFYSGEIDGYSGPNTRRAIETFQTKVGLPVTGLIDDRLMEQLGGTPTTVRVAPIAAPRDVAEAISLSEQASPVPDERIRRIQAGLRAFGNEGIQIDGLLGARTRSALLEFQALFGLREDGEPNVDVEAKMRDIGLIN